MDLSSVTLLLFYFCYIFSYAWGQPFVVYLLPTTQKNSFSLRLTQIRECLLNIGFWSSITKSAFTLFILFMILETLMQPCLAFVSLHTEKSWSNYQIDYPIFAVTPFTLSTLPKMSSPIYGNVTFFLKSPTASITLSSMLPSHFVFLSSYLSRPVLCCS